MKKISFAFFVLSLISLQVKAQSLYKSVNRKQTIRTYMELHGIWHSDQSDTATLNQYGSVTLEFKQDGQLIYTIHEKGKTQYIHLTYEVVNNKLITNQPSNPRKDETDFYVKGNRLELYFGGTRSCYIKE